MPRPHLISRPMGQLGTWLCCLLLCCVASLTVAAEKPAGPSIAVYTNTDVPPVKLSSDLLRSIFGMRSTVWPNGQRIQVFVLPDKHPLHRRFSKSVLGLFPYQLRQVWDRAVFSGTGEAPVQVADELEMLQRLQTTAGAIGYLPLESDPEGVSLVQQP
ncbi:hypothetical protein DV711_00695 [Motiliproteus coralliicola]|uniref:PBP domain-containing protein n=1 Tax=Motiliproteus coralliicola TaxID=2283196 RepID=A0A369WRI2_9GAMM|nr:hypothetical protein [Motiliproteus coralliicola]RDE24151.1 hypothetical protein DV711_00695 [Motiliproteus coralliicola]